jgi:hypothetical protein
MDAETNDIAFALVVKDTVCFEQVQTDTNENVGYEKMKPYLFMKKN